MNEDTSKQMTWHKYGIRHDKDDHGRPMLIHLSCAKAWKSFDWIHHEKAKEAKNAWVAIGLNGLNLFGMVSKTYSCWPVLVAPLNLPPGTILQRKCMFRSLIIPGPIFQEEYKCVHAATDRWVERSLREWDTYIRRYEQKELHNACLVPVLISWLTGVFTFHGVVCAWEVPMPRMQGQPSLSLAATWSQVFLLRSS